AHGPRVPDPDPRRDVPRPAWRTGISISLVHVLSGGVLGPRAGRLFLGCRETLSALLRDPGARTRDLQPGPGHPRTAPERAAGSAHHVCGRAGGGDGPGRPECRRDDGRPAGYLLGDLDLSGRGVAHHRPLLPQSGPHIRPHSVAQRRAVLDLRLDDTVYWAPEYPLDGLCAHADRAGSGLRPPLVRPPGGRGTQSYAVLAGGGSAGRSALRPGYSPARDQGRLRLGAAQPDGRARAR